jgi:hypothetical protein
MNTAAAVAATVIGFGWAAAWPLLGHVDTNLGGDMPTGSRPTLQQRIRRWIGTDTLPRMEHTMATATQQLTDLSNKVDDLINDVRAALTTIGQDTLSTEAQTALDQLNAKIDAFDTEVGDADGSDTPTEPGTDGNV